MIVSRDKHLFRFRGDNVNTISELVNKSIWHSKVDGLNDPLELFFNLDADGLSKLGKDDIARIIKNNAAFRQSPNFFRRCFVRNELEPIYNMIREHWNEEFVGEMISEFRQKTAVACFTKTFDSRLMWGYYGNGMKGICFAYNKEKLSNSGLEFTDVKYVDEAPKVNIYKHLAESLSGAKLTIDADFAVCKHKDWEKEEEVRSLKYLKGDDVYKNNPGESILLNENCVDAIIVGERLHGDMRTFLEDYSKRNDIYLLVAKANFNNYKIQIENLY
ncbi:DUF2971 domain-containing protein [Pantoea sp. DY-5]|uniref:DUF2971 domain-containing protein n=1 Tax=Pantoea sp. DY-5 TaxID=2871488 RepID=UPI001C96C2B2|nr:DUF2971 domain-containing protein [Pantoea sp. DY-5]MBY4838539.1 DUF2971 domain-containing protein [Pantoea sp. DY-5]